MPYQPDLLAWELRREDIVILIVQGDVRSLTKQKGRISEGQGSPMEDLRTDGP